MHFKRFLILLIACGMLGGCGTTVGENTGTVGSASTDRVINSEKEAKQEEKELGLQDKVDTVKDVHKVVSTLDEIEKVGARAALGKGMKKALVQAVVSGLYDDEEEEPPSYLEDDTYFVNLGEYFSLDNGTLSQFELGKLNENGVVEDGDYAGYSLDNFVFVVGEVKNGAMTGWYYVYDQLTMEMYMRNAETGKVVSLIREDERYDDSILENHGFVQVMKDGDKQWRVDIENGNVEYTHGDTFFTGTEYAFDAQIAGHDIKYREFCGATYDDVGNIDSMYLDSSQFTSNMKSILSSITPKRASELQELIANTGGDLITSIPVLDVIDLFSNGTLSKMISDDILDSIVPSAYDGLSAYESQLLHAKYTLKDNRYRNYHAGQIEGYVDVTVRSNEDGEYLDSLSLGDRIVEQSKRKHEKLQELNDEYYEKWKKEHGIEDSNTNSDDSSSDESNSSSKDADNPNNYGVVQKEGESYEHFLKRVRKAQEKYNEEQQKAWEEEHKDELNNNSSSSSSKQYESSSKNPDNPNNYGVVQEDGESYEDFIKRRMEAQKKYNEEQQRLAEEKYGIN